MQTTTTRPEDTPPHLEDTPLRPPYRTAGTPDALVGPAPGSTREGGAREDAPRGGRRLSPLGAVTLGAVAGVGAVLAYLAWYLIEAPVIGTIVGGLTALAALVFVAVGVGWRWTPALATFLALAVSGLLIVSDPAQYVQLAGNPRDPLYLPTVLLVPPLALAAAFGVLATVQNYRFPAGARRAPRWLATSLAAVAGVTAGYLLLALLPRPIAELHATPDGLARLPGIETREFQFRSGELRIRAGEAVAMRLMNADKAPHSFDVDELGVHAAMTPGQPGLVVFTADRPGTYTFYCAVPGHADKATGQGMVGRLVVTS